MSKKNKVRKIVDQHANADQPHTDVTMSTGIEIDDIDVRAKMAELEALMAQAKKLKAEIGSQKTVVLSSKKLDLKRKWAEQNLTWLESASLRFAKRMLTMNQALATLEHIEVDRCGLAEGKCVGTKLAQEAMPYQAAFENLPAAVQKQAQDELSSNLAKDE